MDETEFMSPREVREWLNISRSKAAQLCSNELPSYRIGTLVRVRREDVEEFLAKNRRPSEGGGPSRSAMEPHAG